MSELDWSYNPQVPKRDVLELGTLKSIDAREDVLLIGKPGTGKSHVAKALALLAVERGYKVLYREAQQLIEDITEARELGTIRKYRAQLKKVVVLKADSAFAARTCTCHGAGSGQKVGLPADGVRNQPDCAAAAAISISHFACGSPDGEDSPPPRGVDHRDRPIGCDEDRSSTSTASRWLVSHGFPVH